MSYTAHPELDAVRHIDGLERSDAITFRRQSEERSELIKRLAVPGAFFTKDIYGDRLKYSPDDLLSDAVWNHECPRVRAALDKLFTSPAGNELREAVADWFVGVSDV